MKWHSVIKINENWSSLVYASYLVIETYHTQYNISEVIIQLEISNDLPNFRLIHLQIIELNEGHCKQQVWNFILCNCVLSFPGWNFGKLLLSLLGPVGLQTTFVDLWVFFRKNI